MILTPLGWRRFHHEKQCDELAHAAGSVARRHPRRAGRCRMRHVDITLERPMECRWMDSVGVAQTHVTRVVAPGRGDPCPIVPEDSGHLYRWDIVFNPPQELLRIEDLR